MDLFCSASERQRAHLPLRSVPVLRLDECAEAVREGRQARPFSGTRGAGASASLCPARKTVRIAACLGAQDAALRRQRLLLRDVLQLEGPEPVSGFVASRVSCVLNTAACLDAVPEAPADAQAAASKESGSSMPLLFPLLISSSPLKQYSVPFVSSPTRIISQKLTYDSGSLLPFGFEEAILKGKNAEKAATIASSQGPTGKKQKKLTGKEAAAQLLTGMTALGYGGAAAGADEEQEEDDAPEGAHGASADPVGWKFPAFPQQQYYVPGFQQQQQPQQAPDAQRQQHSQLHVAAAGRDQLSASAASGPWGASAAVTPPGWPQGGAADPSAQLASLQHDTRVPRLASLAAHGAARPAAPGATDPSVPGAAAGAHGLSWLFEPPLLPSGGAAPGSSQQPQQQSGAWAPLQAASFPVASAADGRGRGRGGNAPAASSAGAAGAAGRGQGRRGPNGAAATGPVAIAIQQGTGNSLESITHGDGAAHAASSRHEGACARSCGSSLLLDGVTCVGCALASQLAFPSSNLRRLRSC